MALFRTHSFLHPPRGRGLACSPVLCSILRASYARGRFGGLGVQIEYDRPTAAPARPARGRGVCGEGNPMTNELDAATRDIEAIRLRLDRLQEGEAEYPMPDFDTFATLPLAERQGLLRAQFVRQRAVYQARRTLYDAQREQLRLLNGHMPEPLLQEARAELDEVARELDRIGAAIAETARMLQMDT